MSPVIFGAELKHLVDGHFDRAFADGIAPGMSYGVVHGSTLVHARGLGVASVDHGVTPDARTVYRIASMTKSFTAATLLSLRDDGLVQLDAPACSYIAELRRPGWISQVTVRQLLTMTAGFLTDDPWGDRQQAMTAEDFRVLLSGSLTPSWRPGQRFEYSNLGYAMLGLVIETVTGQAYRSVVRDRILLPLEMSDSGYTTAEIASSSVASGYVQRDETWQVEPLAGYGAFAPMGGLLSSVRDTARWVGAMVVAYADDHVVPTLHPTTLREMQSGQRFIEVLAQPAAQSDDTSLEVRHYGYGLFEEHLEWGRSVAHSGGYPGFGSHMRWHPASGLGIVALANRTYAPVGKVATAALADLVGALDPASAKNPLEPALHRAREAVTALLNEWDDEVVRACFTRTVGEDEPWERRRTEARQLAERHGLLRPVPGPLDPPQSPGHVVWWLGGELGGQVRCEALLGPAPGHLIQWVRWQSVQEPPRAVRETAEHFVAKNHPDVTVGQPLGGNERVTTLLAVGPGDRRWEVTVGPGLEVSVRPTPVRVADGDP